MPPSPTPLPSAGRRRALAVFVNTAVALVSGGLSALVGAFALRPSAAAARKRWIRAAATSDLKSGVPIARVIAVPLVDGWYRDHVRRTVFLVWDGDKSVRALSGTCTHLGCQVGWDGATKRFRCPCHGGVFDAQGRVASGPPPRPLETLGADILDNGDVMVRL
jgi:Rieske Fe-S protein